MFLTLVVPVRLAFQDDDPIGWVVAYTAVDFSFLIDIIITFFTSYTDGDNVEVTQHKRIMKNYIKFWFWIDLLSIIPFDYLFNGDSASALNINALFRFAKFSKIYKIVRLTRLAKVFKLLKKNKALISRFSEKLKLNSGLERLFIFSFAFAIFIHVMGCMYVMLADIEKEIVELTWIDQEELDGDEIFNGR